MIFKKNKMICIKDKNNHINYIFIDKIILIQCIEQKVKINMEGGYFLELIFDDFSEGIKLILDKIKGKK